MLSLFTTISLLLTLYFSSFLIVLFKNYLKARTCGFPIVILPIDVNHLVWMIVSVPLRPVLKRYLPYWLFSRITLGIYGWEFHEKRIPFRSIGSPTFVVVTCNKNEFWSQDPEVVAELLKMHDEYLKPEISCKVLDTFGTNVMTSEGESWVRQRKLITGVINERISKVVFEETWRQSRGMLKDVEDKGQGKVAEKQSSGATNSGSVYAAAFPAMKRIASNVLFRSAYGLPQDFKESSGGDDSMAVSHSGAKRNFDMLDCITIVIANLVPAAFFPEKILLRIPSWMPFSNWAQDLGTAQNKFPVIVKQRLDQEREELARAKDGEVRSNLTSMLIQASEMGGEENGANIKSSNEKQQRMLSETELRGNLFVFTVAGFETTANALTFTLVSLMAQPELQDWLCEEIDELFADARLKNSEKSDEELMDYVAFYPKAFRCLALMLETLRLYPPIIHIMRSTPKHNSSTLKKGTKTHTIPADSHIFGSLCALHTDPQVWRNLNLPQYSGRVSSETSNPVLETMEDVFSMTQDEYAFRPSRWVNESLKQMPDGSMSKSLFQPPRGAYAPFAGGPRVCPGQKMAQVEFVCVILTLFREYKVEVVKLPGEDDEKSRKRLRQILKDCHAELTLVMERLHEIEVRFIRRDKA